ncbi:MAG: SDR family oxidoreductase [archaeon]|nr:SDR family oxidoreductase [archaeon]
MAALQDDCVLRPTVLRNKPELKRDIKVLITGATGLLGRALVTQFADYDVYAQGFTRVAAEDDWVRTPARTEDPTCGSKTMVKCDLTDEAQLRALFSKVEPQVIIHSAAERRPDVVEKQDEATRALNVKATEVLAGLASGREDCFLLLISTDYVFDGTQPPYKPNAVPHPLNKYGQSKLDAEKALQASEHHGGILRVPILYGRTADLNESAVTCLIPALLAAHQKGEQAKMDHWGRRFPTLVDDVALVCYQLTERRLRHCSLSGIWHWSGPQAMTKYDMAVALAPMLGLPADFIVPVPEPPSDNIRPQDAQLDTNTLYLMGIGRKTSFADGMKLVLADFPELSV